MPGTEEIIWSAVPKCTGRLSPSCQVDRKDANVCFFTALQVGNNLDKLCLKGNGENKLRTWSLGELMRTSLILYDFRLCFSHK